MRNLVLAALLLSQPVLAQEATPLTYREAVGRFLTQWGQRTAPPAAAATKAVAAPPAEAGPKMSSLTMSLTNPAPPEEKRLSSQQVREAQEASLAFRQAYLETLRCGEGIIVLEAQLKQAEDCLRTAEELNRTGQVPTFDVHQLKTLVLRVQEGLARARSARESSQARLVYLLTQPRGSRVAPAEHLLPKPDPALWADDRETAQIRELEALNERALNSRAELQELRARFTPAPTAGTNPERVQFGLSVSNLSPVSGRSDQNLVGMLSASLPWGSGSSTVGVTDEKLDAARLQARALEGQVLLEVEQAWWAVQEADKSFELSALAADHAAEAVRLGRIRYGVGATPAGELVNALTAQSEAQLNLLQAAYEQPLARLKLALAVGVLP